MRRRTLLAAAIATAARPALSQTPATPLTVFAAASLTDVFKELGNAWTAKGGGAISFSFAASSTLARQIGQGAPADLFASADEQWMNDLQERDLVVPASRVSPIGNSLVLIAPAGQARPVSLPLLLDRSTDLVALLGKDGRLACGDPAHVPAGIYARQALTWMGQWDAIQPRLANADNVRSALLLVERGEAPYGIVYGTDAAIDPGVKVVATFPEASHEPVTYPFAVCKAAAGRARAAGLLLAFLAGPDAAGTFRRYGFTTLPQH